MKDKINKLNSDIQIEFETVANLKSLEDFRIKYLSRNGLFAELFEEFKLLSPELKRETGKLLNELKNSWQTKFDLKSEELKNSSESIASKIDISLPGIQKPSGSVHLINSTMDEIKSIFRNIGFSVITGPEVESDYYNFEALNFPPDHPARDMQDTYFINQSYVLRTHTTPVQIRIMEKQEPPVRAIMPGKVYRNEAISARSYNLFHQIDGIYVDKKVTFSELKGTLIYFAKEFYGSSLKYRFRASFFPFTEPSAEMDISCFLCNGKGCRVCKNSGWLEILGCGMVDPNVLKSVSYDPDKYSGYAFGMGIERIAMLKNGITDIRILYNNDIRFLKQF